MNEDEMSQTKFQMYCRLEYQQRVNLTMTPEIKAFIIPQKRPKFFSPALGSRNRLLCSQTSIYPMNLTKQLEYKPKYFISGWQFFGSLQIWNYYFSLQGKDLFQWPMRPQQRSLNMWYFCFVQIFPNIQ